MSLHGGLDSWREPSHGCTDRSGNQLMMAGQKCMRSLQGAKISHEASGKSAGPGAADQRTTVRAAPRRAAPICLTEEAAPGDLSRRFPMELIREGFWLLTR